jgi:uncharacterized protein
MNSEVIIIVSVIAMLASLLTFFSGFGLGTLLLPVFAAFFPIETAVGATAIVHFSNNIFKLVLMMKSINRRLVLKFGLPAIAGSVAGAVVLLFLNDLEPLVQYEFLAKTFSITPVKLAIALLISGFSLLELSKSFSRVHLGEKYLIPGGVVSGFFGGLSGHQGALRSVFLIRLSGTKEIFIATGTAIACLVDLSRLPVYFSRDTLSALGDNHWVLLFPILAAFIGVFTGSRLLNKITFSWLQKTVAIFLLIFAILMGLGII